MLIRFLLVLCTLVGVLAIYFATRKALWVKLLDVGRSEHAKQIATYIQGAAKAFLFREYIVLSYAVVGTALLLFFMNSGPLCWTAFAFVIGAVLSGSAGFLGMMTATYANLRTAQAAHTSIAAGLSASFGGGTVMGMYVVGFMLTGISVLLQLLIGLYGMDIKTVTALILPSMFGFSFGASSVALFARVGGGIYTKAADVAADIVGKIEKGIPEDDVRNPAVIADFVGDNVGDVAGMGADLFESGAGSLLAAATIGATTGNMWLVLFPLVISSVGIIVSIIATFLIDGTVGKHTFVLPFGSYDLAPVLKGWVAPVAAYVRTQLGVSDDNAQFSLNFASFGAAGLVLLVMFPLSFGILPGEYMLNGVAYHPLSTYAALIVGVLSGVVNGKITEYYTSGGRKPVQRIVDASGSGPATNVLAGLSVGNRSVPPQILCLMLATYVAFWAAGLYGVALAAVAMLSTTPIQLATDAFGPIADNAGGIAEMTGMHEEVRKRTDALDALGNTTAATGKGFAIGSAVMTALALLSAYATAAGLTVVNMLNIDVLIGGFLGAVLVHYFIADTFDAVWSAASTMIDEVRRQFRERPELMDKESGARADYAKCVDISTAAALKEMVKPCSVGILAPLVIGFIGGREMLGGFFAVLTIAGATNALLMANAGGAWDNAKKWLERDSKHSLAHQAAVIGDTVGDPFKDTSGPALNILIKIAITVGMLFVSFF
jgi:K(+)-stimulated pyrophosphate-energized sodium pump